MCKKLIVFFLTLMISLFATGCTRPFADRDADVYEKIHKYYSKMTCYSADLDLTVFSNKTENRYFVSQKASLPDKYYTRVTDSQGTFSVITITNGKTTKALADGSEYSLTIPSPEYLSVLFVNNFFTTYYASEETALYVNNSIKNGEKTVLEVELFNEDLCIDRVSMSIDNKTLLPDVLTAFDKDGNTNFIARFENFNYNEKIDDSIFNTD